METDHIFFHELHKKRRSQLVDVITILIPILVLLFAITKLSQNNDKYNYIYMFCAIILLSTAIDRKKTVDIKLKSDGIEILGSNSRFYPYSKIKNIECVRITKRAWFVIPLWTDMIITIEIARNEKYCLRRSQVQDFDLLWDRLKEAYTRYLEEEYGGEDISQSQIYFGQRLWIKGGKLVFGFTYDVPLEKINARFNEKGYLDIIYRAKNGDQTIWITLDSDHFQKTFLLYYLLKENAVFEIDSELLDTLKRRRILRFID